MPLKFVRFESTLPPDPEMTGTPIGMLLTLTRVSGGGDPPPEGLAGTPIGMLLTITREVEAAPPPGASGTPLGMLLTITNA